MFHLCYLSVLRSQLFPTCISLSPEEHVEIGTNVTIRCWNKKYGVAFFLHKDGHSAPIQRQKLSFGGTATFTLFGVTQLTPAPIDAPTASGAAAFCSHPLGIM